ncbi:hypothetical protein [Autumnicola psychrophila]|uniref:Uncharacterized protein n=1 Tax=Autumnicola psychrophila TaxID=3075592 RepID=A0ABU3DVV6_9FLAO|nr:hypothetical protein [Zunongwangia sp. F225]MDT0687207.1 hypothetical protein [Zunongwangia sp. F225]
MSFGVVIDSEFGNKSFFLKFQQEEMSWWHPSIIQMRPILEITSDQGENDHIFLQIRNISEENIEGELILGIGKAEKWKTSA